MDTARQVIRWSIPGWVFLFMLALLQILTWLGEGRPVGSIIEIGIPFITPGAVAMVVTAGVPLGFILYQVYYSWYGAVLPFCFVNRDRGAEILLALPQSVRDMLASIEGQALDLEDMSDCIGPYFMPYPFRRLKSEYRNTAGKTRFAEKVHHNWDLIRFWLHRICFINKTELLRSEVITLSDIYHAVGAARAALFLACLAHLLVNTFVLQTNLLALWRLAAAVIAPYGLAFWLFRVFERTRSSALNSLLSILTLAFKTFPARSAEGTIPAMVPMEPIAHDA